MTEALIVRPSSSHLGRCRVGNYADGEEITDAAEFSSRIFSTVYMGTVNSSRETRQRAKTLASEVGTYHMDVDIDTVVTAVTTLFATITGRRPAFRVRGYLHQSLSWTLFSVLQSTHAKDCH